MVRTKKVLTEEEMIAKKLAEKERNRARYLANREEIIARNLAYRANNLEHLRAKEKERRARPEVKARYKELMTKWIDENREHYLNRMREYRKGYEKRPDVIPTKRARDLFNKWLKYEGTAKHSSVFKLIRLTKPEFREYMESRFTEGMAWDNIHIDHYVPLSYFDPHSEEDRQIAWHWMNLQPLFEKDNLSKNDTIPADYLEHIEKIKQAIAFDKQRNI
jgi:hypothetical protein